MSFGWKFLAILPATLRNVVTFFCYLKGYAVCRRPFLAPRGSHLESLVPPCWYLGGPFWHLGTPRQQYYGFEVVWHRIYIDFGMILRPYFEFCWHRGLKFKFCSGLFPGPFLYPFFTEIGFYAFQARCFHFFSGLETSFLISVALETCLKMNGFSGCSGCKIHEGRRYIT